MRVSFGAVLLLFALTTSSVVAQHLSSPAGFFEVDNISGCKGLTINITYHNPCAGVCEYALYLNSTKVAGAKDVASVTIPQPGSYRLEILFQGQAAGSAIDGVNIEVSPDTPPAFELYTCADNRLAFNITDTNFDNYIIDFGDGTPPQVLDRDISLKGTHTYATSGSKNVSVTGRDDNAPLNCTPAIQTINVMATLPVPTINSLQVVNESSIRVAFNGLPNIVYRLEVAPNNAPSFQVLKTLYNVTADTIRNIKTEDNFYCYRLGVVNPCTGQIQYSPVICSANVDLTVQNNQNVLSWLTRTAGVTNFRISITTTGSNLQTNATASPYTDTNVKCGQEYCYQLTTLYPNGAQSTSLIKCGTAISNDIPDPVANISAIVTNSGVDLVWQPNPDFSASEYFLQKTVNGNLAGVQSTKAPSYTDPEYTQNSGTCYKVYYRDVCGNQSKLSAEACPIQLTASVARDNTITLSWSGYVGWQNGVRNYIVQKFTPEGALLETNNVGSETTGIDDREDILHQTNVYVVTANATDNGVQSSVSNRVTVIKNPNLFYPTAFTPNNDLLNDLFNVYGQFISEFEMSIFNRWGELMYTTNSLAEGWDGNYKGNQMPEGTYTFVVKIVDLAGRNIKQSGSVLLLRKK